MKTETIHETTKSELNPKTMNRRDFELPNGMKFIYSVCTWDEKQLAVEVHYYYPTRNEYVVDVVPAHWLNSKYFYETAANSPYFIKFVHELDMGDHS
jgi:hypothetical protein